LSPKLREEPIDSDLAKIKADKLQRLMEERKGIENKKLKQDNRNLSKSQQWAIKMLEDGVAYEIVTQSVDFGEPNKDTKQVERFNPNRKGIIVSLLLEPEEKQWIENILLALKDVPLKRSEVDLCVKHIKRLNYEGALRDVYEFYGLTLKELEEKEEEERAKGHVAKADRLQTIIERNAGRK